MHGSEKITEWKIKSTDIRLLHVEVGGILTETTNAFFEDDSNKDLGDAILELPRSEKKSSKIVALLNNFTKISSFTNIT